MEAGRLRDRVGFYPLLPSVNDGYGNEVSGHASLPSFQCSAAIEPKLAGETVLAGRLTGRDLVNITVRRSSLTATVDPTWKVRDERSRREYNIRSIIDPLRGKAGQNAWLEMLCEAGVANLATTP